jgi:RND family efflux transporter MFP subunit
VLSPFRLVLCGRLVPLLAIMLAAGGAMLGCSKPNEYAPPPPPTVTVAKPVERELVRQLEFTGTTSSVEAVDIRARVTGYLQSIEFEDGAQVEAGDLLFVIEPAPFDAALDSAKAALQRAEASLGLARANLARAERLPPGAISAQEVDVARASVATAEADVASAKAALRQAELDLAYTQIKSPIRGRVSRHLVDVGNLVQPGETVLTRVEAFDPIHTYFAISESDVLEFMRANQGSTMELIRENAPPIYMGLAGEEGFPHEGRLDFAELGVDPQTGTQMRRGVFPNPDGTLLPGLFARIRLPVGQPRPGLMLPDRAIATDQRGDYVLAVNEKDTVEYRPVELGMRVGGMRQILSGVNKEDWIVINGVQRARPGAPVTPERTDEIPEAAALAQAGDPAIPQTTQGQAVIEQQPEQAPATGGN